MIKIFGLRILTGREMRDMDAAYIALRQARDAARHRASVMDARNAELRARNAELIEIVDKRNLTIVELDKQIAALEKQLQAEYGCALKARTAEAGRTPPMILDKRINLPQEDDMPEGCVHAIVPRTDNPEAGCGTEM